MDALSHPHAFATLGRFGAALLLATIVLGVSPGVKAEEPSSHASVLLELDASIGGPFGPASVGIGYATAGRWTVGLGVGFFAPSVYVSDWRPLGLFARAPLWRSGLLSIALGTTLSRSSQEVNQDYSGPNVAPAAMTWYWAPGYRADVSGIFELAGREWSLRLEPGLGYYLNSPQCYYFHDSTYFSGSCDSAEIPSTYRSTISPGQLVPSITIAAGLRLGDSGDGIANPSPPTDWTGKTWMGAIILGDLAGAAGSLALGEAFWQLTHNCSNNNSSDFQFPPCGLVETLFGATLGWTVGITTGVYLAGRYSARPDGRWGPTFLGALIGSAMAGLFALTVYELGPSNSRKRNDIAVYGGLALGAILPTGMAAVFYRRSASPALAGIALLDYSPGQGLAPTIPVPSVTTANGRASVSVGLLGGQF